MEGGGVPDRLESVQGDSAVVRDATRSDAVVAAYKDWQQLSILNTGQVSCRS
jgi:hypothetical protein